jgi:glycosyltransferase involved in cell wall biosynthesis
MHVAWITTGFLKNEHDYDGAAFMHTLAKGIASTGAIKLTIFQLYYPVGTGSYNFYNANVFLCRSKGIESVKIPKLQKIKAAIKCISQFKQEHLKDRFDVIHSIWSGESGLVSSYLSKKFKIPLIASICGGELTELPEIKYGSRLKFFQKRFVDRTFEQAKVIVAGCDYIINRMKQYYNFNVHAKTVKIPFGVDEKRFYNFNQKKIDRTKPIKLINIATAVPVKSHINLFKAIKIVAEHKPDVVLECYGKDDKGTLLKLAEQTGVRGNVRLNGFIEYEKVPEALHNADIFVLSSLYESQNMAVLEAAFCGLPVVSTDVGIAPEITKNIVKPGDPDALAQKILEVIDNPTNGYENLYTKFSSKFAVKRFVQLYYSVR